MTTGHIDRSTTNWLEECLVALLPASVAVHAEITEQDLTSTLLPAELAATDGMAKKRLHEFARGRHCAHRAMEKLGHSATAIAKGKQREPVWPDVLVGSITHTTGAAAAAAGYSDAYNGIGLDVEQLGSVETGAAKLIVRPDEAAADGDSAKRLFGMKEAIYKAIYPTVRRFVDFQEMRVEIDAHEQTFLAHPSLKDYPEDFLSELRGRFCERNGLLICCAWWPS